MRRMLINLLVGLVTVYAGLCVALFLLQRSMLYSPTPAGDRSNVPILTLSSSAGPVLVSTRPVPGPQALIYFGGNAEDVSYSLPELAEAFPRHSIYTLHYRGYGGSAGSPSEEALHADAIALYEKVRAEHPEITVIGRSLGSGLAVRLASLHPVRKLILVTPYDSILGIGQAHFAIFPVRWLLRDKYEAWRDAPRITASTKILAAENDEVIPRASTELLVTRFRPGVATYTVIPRTSHNTVSESAEYWRQLN